MEAKPKRSYKNYLIDSSSRSVRKNVYISALVATLSQMAFWLNVWFIFDVPLVLLAFLLPAGVLLWLGVWWAVLDRLVTYVGWLSYWREVYDKEYAEMLRNSPPHPAIIERYYQLTPGGDYLLYEDMEAGKGDWGVDGKEA